MICGSQSIKTSNVVLYVVFLCTCKQPSPYYFMNKLRTIQPEPRSVPSVNESNWARFNHLREDVWGRLFSLYLQQIVSRLHFPGTGYEKIAYKCFRKPSNPTPPINSERLRPELLHAPLKKIHYHERELCMV